MSIYFPVNYATIYDKGGISFGKINDPCEVELIKIQIVNLCRNLTYPYNKLRISFGSEIIDITLPFQHYSSDIYLAYVLTTKFQFSNIAAVVTFEPFSGNYKIQNNSSFHDMTILSDGQLDRILGFSFLTVIPKGQGVYSDLPCGGFHPPLFIRSNYIGTMVDNSNLLNYYDYPRKTYNTPVIYSIGLPDFNRNADIDVTGIKWIYSDYFSKKMIDMDIIYPTGTPVERSVPIILWFKLTRIVHTMKKY
jgi:hypothetical protein